jgi:hypothetical protein
MKASHPVTETVAQWRGGKTFKRRQESSQRGPDRHLHFNLESTSWVGVASHFSCRGSQRNSWQLTQGEMSMKVAKDDVDVKMQIPGAVIRQQTDFGDATGLGKISGEYFSLSAGVDTTPLFQGLDGNLCQCPHWGFVVRGQLTTIDAEGMRETVNANDLFYWPPGHNVKVEADAEIVMFSPQHEHSLVINHMIKKVMA